jgi:lysylphosphatidylglycerol synthetase-like protein (DUF2156 family)
MEQPALDFFKNRFTIKGIFASRKMPKRRIVTQLILISLILGYPLSTGIYDLDFEMAGITAGAEMYAALSLMMYPLTIILNIIFLASVSALTLFLNYSTVEKLKYREFFALISYAATVPAILALLLGTFVSIAFVYLAYNFGTVIWAYYVYKKGQQASFREIHGDYEI